MRFLQKAKLFLAEERGSNAIEYGLIASLIAVAIITAVTAVGTELTTSPNLSLYKIVVFPAASSPSINILISFLPMSPSNNLEKYKPIYNII